MQTSWKKLENEHGFPFYLNENTQQIQWDHPKFIELKHLIDDCNYVKYSKYRVALKFRTLQKALFMEDVQLNTVLGVFLKHQLGTNESTLCLESYDLEAVLFDIYFAAKKLNHRDFDVDFAVEMMQNYLYNIYDKERQIKIQVASTKLALALLCDNELPQLYNLIFTLCADHNNCVTRLRLQSLLAKFVEIFVFMHEDVSFGQHLINPTIENCFSNSPGLVGLCENNFISWLEEAPQLFSWIPILSRIKTCERVVHNSKCSTCKMSPVVGLMYRCTKCSKYIQCQRCFFTGCVNNSHKLSHSMKEYSTSEDTTKEFNFKFIKKLCGLMPCSIKLNETDNSIVQAKPASFANNFFVKSENENLICHKEPSGSPQAQLQLIIKELEFQNRELHRILLLGSHNEKEIRKYLEEHKVEVATQIHKLKILKECLHDGFQLPPRNILESTPMVGVGKMPKRTEFESLLSPITQLSECNEKPSSQQVLFSNDTAKDITNASLPYSINNISTWIKDQPKSSKNVTEHVRNSPVRELHNDLDDALAKLQQILANNFTLDESLGTIDNNHLKHAVSEVEGMLTSFIDNVESSRASSVQPFKQT